MNASEAKVVTVLEPSAHTFIEQRILIFCTRHPKMKFTLECILTDHEGNEFDLHEEIEDLVNDGILEKQISNAGTVWYYILN